MNLEEMRERFEEVIYVAGNCPPFVAPGDAMCLHHGASCLDCAWAYITGGEDAVRKLHSNTLNTAEESADTSLD